MAKVVLESVSKRWGDVTAVDRVSLEAADGEFLVLVGPSGCGKSTCLRMIAGLEEASSGDIHIGSVRVNDTPPKDRDIGMVFQSYALYPHLTVRENLAFGLKLRKAAKPLINERVAAAAEMLELGELLERRPKELSGGQRQRVAIGRAIAREPRVFLFDEPLSNLDAAMRVAMRTELAALHARLGATMIYVTHDQVEAMTLADRIAVLRDGVLQQIGRPLELYRTPANRFVAGFIGSPGMNFFPVSAASETTLTVNGHSVPRPAELRSDALAEIGVRPANLILGDGPFRGAVVLVEMLGSEAFVHLECGTGPAVIVRADGSNAANLDVGDKVSFDIDVSEIHGFDSAGERV